MKFYKGTNMKTFMLWNPEKVSQYMKIREEDQTVASILSTEEKNGESVYSIVRAEDFDHAQQIATACYNETDIHVRIAHVPERVHVAVYDIFKYNDYAQARAAGDVHLMSAMPLNDLITKPEVREAVYNAINMASFALTNDSGRLEIVVVSADFGTEIPADYLCLLATLGA